MIINKSVCYIIDSILRNIDISFLLGYQKHKNLRSIKSCFTSLFHRYSVAVVLKKFRHPREITITV